MDNLLNDELYYEKLDDTKLSLYIDNLQTIVLEILNEKNNYNIKYINIGIKTIMHVMYNIFINTKNIEITTYYGKMSIAYYFEFINQLCSNNANNFINLTLQDAIIFVYKKTIFNLDTEYKKHYNNYYDDKILDKIFIINNIINSFHAYNDYIPIKYKHVINKLLNISNKTDILTIKQIVLILINNNIDMINIFNFIMTLSKKKDITINNSNIYNFNYTDNFSIKTYINHLVSI